MVAGRDHSGSRWRVWSACCGSTFGGRQPGAAGRAADRRHATGIIAILLPYTAESFPLRVRGRATGVAACTKAGGLFAQFLAILALVPALQFVSLVLIVPTIAALGLVAWFGKETRGRDLRDLDPDGHTFAATGI